MLSRRGAAENLESAKSVSSQRQRLVEWLSVRETETVGVGELDFDAVRGAFRMNPNVTSVFDLSPSEKLQLVEDLWDDLAATPDAIPVHEWQKEELDRRKANLLQNPGTGLTWDEVQRRVRSRYDR